MAQLRAKQIKLAAQGDLLIGGTNGNGDVLPKGDTVGQVLKIVAGGALGYEALSAAETTYNNSTSGLTATDVNSAIDEVKSSVDSVVTELGAIETAVGLDENGDLVAFAADGHASGQTTFKAAVEAIDAALVAAEADLLAVEGELNSLETTVGAKEDGTANYYSSGNYIVQGSDLIPANGEDPEVPAVTPDNHTVALGKLDTALKVVDDEITVTQTGAGLEATGAYVAETAYDESTNPTGAHYITTATSLKGADKLLDAKIKEVSDAVDSLSGGGSGSLGEIQEEVDAIEAAIGLDENGDLVAFATGGKAEGKTSFKAAVEAIDAGLTTVEGDLDALESTVSGIAGLGALRFDGEVDGNETSTAPYDAETNTGGLQVTPETGDVYRVTTTANVNWAGTGLEVNVGDYVVKTTDSWVKFDNTDPVVTGSGVVTVTGGAHEGYTVDVTGEDLTSPNSTITITGGTGSVLADVTLDVDPSAISFSDLAQTGTPEDGKFLKWDAGTSSLVYVTAAEIGASNHSEEDFTPATAANATATLTYTPITGSVAVYINGVKLKNSGFSVDTGTKVVTLVDSANGYGIETGDTLSVSYNYTAAA